ncbi:MAG: hypothetical protein HY909_15930, partial [Deltaproteobacteria bacterium]|nr:hypothetical protein [Deltaproteobacteria bacterium]
MRNLEQIREHDDPGGSSRLMSIALGGLATACVLFAVGVLVGRESGPEARAGREDPLARLDALAAPPGERPVTYPDRLLGATPVPGPEAPAGSVASASALGAPPAANTAAAAVPVILPTLAPAARPVLVPSVGASPQGIRLSVTPAAGAPGSALAPAPGAG